MAFKKGGFIITTATQYIARTGIEQTKLRDIARLLNVPNVTEPIRTIVVFDQLEDKK